jgi:hypothetical protein
LKILSTSIPSQHILCSVAIFILKINYFFGAKAEIIYLPRPRVLYMQKRGKILCTGTPIAAGMNAPIRSYFWENIFMGFE